MKKTTLTHAPHAGRIDLEDCVTAVDAITLTHAPHAGRITVKADKLRGVDVP